VNSSGAAKPQRKASLILYGLLSAGMAAVVYPFWFMLNNSFKPGMEIMHYPLSLPKNWTVDGYVKVFTELNMGRLFANTVLVAGSVTVLNCLLNAMVAYALTKLAFRGREALFGMILSTMMIPGILLLIPTYMFMYRIGWVDTYQVLIVPSAVSAYNIFLIRQFYTQIPDDFVEAAKIDGANHGRIFASVILPMSKPVLATIAVLSFMGSWNDLFGPLLYLRDETKYTLQLGLYKYQTQIPGENLEQIWAALTTTTLPVVAVYFFLQKYFVEAFTGVGLK
jgi:multiple sugar transport system permease protein